VDQRDAVCHLKDEALDPPTVSAMWLAAGMTEQEILDNYPELEPDDFRAVYEFAARMGRRVVL
jgi:uncharacterized protein (DUF433 family)